MGLHADIGCGAKTLRWASVLSPGESDAACCALDAGQLTRADREEAAPDEEADARTRTGDPFITSEVLYQLSYVGLAGSV
jgi:hypothetical protein